VSVDILFKLIDRRSTLLVGMSVDTWLTPRLTCCDEQSLVYRLTVGGIGDATEESLSSMSKDAAQTAVILNRYLMQLEVSTSIHVAGKSSL